MGNVLALATTYAVAAIAGTVGKRFGFEPGYVGASITSGIIHSVGCQYLSVAVIMDGGYETFQTQANSQDYDFRVA